MSLPRHQSRKLKVFSQTLCLSTIYAPRTRTVFKSSGCLIPLRKVSAGVKYQESIAKKSKLCGNKNQQSAATHGELNGDSDSDYNDAWAAHTLTQAFARRKGETAELLGLGAQGRNQARVTTAATTTKHQDTKGRIVPAASVANLRVASKAESVFVGGYRGPNLSLYTNKAAQLMFDDIELTPIRLESKPDLRVPMTAQGAREPGTQSGLVHNFSCKTGIALRRLTSAGSAKGALSFPKKPGTSGGARPGFRKQRRIIRIQEMVCERGEKSWIEQRAGRAVQGPRDEDQQCTPEG